MMTKYAQPKRKLRTAHSRIWIAVVMATFLPYEANAGIVTDTSLGHASQTLSGNMTISQTMGSLSGNNLFHSFQTFNISTGESANFTTSTSGIANVISRVTGGSLSQINGALSLTPCGGCGAPNFFFINPAGVTFGAGASINVPGAFHVSTADYVKFPDGNFYADLSKASTFSVASPEAFGFLGTSRASITINEGATLSAQPLQPISIVAGDIEINNGTVSTEGNNVRVVAVGLSAEEIGFSGPLPAASGYLYVLNGGIIYSSTSGSENAGDVSVSAGSITIDGTGSSAFTGITSQANPGSTGNAGTVDVTAAGNTFIINGGAISSDTNSSGNAGAVNITATGSLSLTNGGTIDSATYSSGTAGSIFVNTDSLNIDSGGGINGFTGIASQANSGTGNAGDINVTVSGLLKVINGGEISSDTFSQGNAGSLTINAGSIKVDGQGSGTYTGISSTANPDSTGNAGTVTVTTTGDLSIVSGGEISTDTHSSGKAGAVNINAGSISIDPGSTFDFTGIASNANAGTGDAGTVTVNTPGKLDILNGGYISSDTWSAGHAGKIQVTAGSINIDGMDYFTGITSKAHSSSSNDAGSIEVTTTGSLTIVNGGQIITDTFSNGKGGDITVTAGSIEIDQQTGSHLTGILSDAAIGSSGDAGTVTVATTGNLSIYNQGLISSQTYSDGFAGKVTVNAGNIIIDGRGSYTGISSDANADSTGDAGIVKVTATGELSVVNGGAISSDTYAQGNAGSVTVTAGSISLNCPGHICDGYAGAGISSNTYSGAKGDAGAVTVGTSGSLSIVNGGEISSDTYSFGNAGKVTVAADSISIDGQGYNGTTGISSKANLNSVHDAGTVSVTATGNLSIVNGGIISSDTYSSGKAGMVTVSANTISVDGQGSGISSSAQTDSSGQTGDVNVTATDTITLSNGGQLSIQNQAWAYDPAVLKQTLLTVTAPTISLNGGQITAANFGNVNAGIVDITATGLLSVLNGGAITSSTKGSGNAGTITVNTNAITIDGQGSSSITGITTNANSGTGNAGSVNVTGSGNISITNGGQIASATLGSGNAGKVTVKAGTLLVDGAGSSINALADVDSSGQTGDVSVTATDSITLSNGGQLSIQNNATVADPRLIQPTSITVNAPRINILNSPNAITTSSVLINPDGTMSGNVAAGSITINASDALYLDPSGITTTSNLGDGGAISINAGMLTLNNSQISTSVLGLNNNGGNGGNISISANTLILNTGFIQANTAAANASGGTVSIAAQNLIPSGNSLFLGGSTPYAYQPGVFGFNVIQAAAPTGVSGTVQTTSPALDIAGSLSGLSTQLIDAGGLGRNPCQATGGSSMSQTGRGGLPPSARGLLRAELPLSPTMTGYTSPVVGRDMRIVLSGWSCS